MFTVDIFTWKVRLRNGNFILAPTVGYTIPAMWVNIYHWAISPLLSLHLCVPYGHIFWGIYISRMTGNLDFMDLFFTNCSLGHVHKWYPAPLTTSPMRCQTRRYKGQRDAIKGSVAEHHVSTISMQSIDRYGKQNCGGHVREIAQRAPPQSIRGIIFHEKQQKREICKI